MRIAEFGTANLNLKFEIRIGGVVQLVRASRGVSREGCGFELYSILLIWDKKFFDKKLAKDWGRSSIG